MLFFAETLGKAFVINAPWVFPIIYGLIKVFVDPVTVAKIAVYSSDYKEDLLKLVDADQIPGQSTIQFNSIQCNANPFNSIQIHSIVLHSVSFYPIAFNCMSIVLYFNSI
jgi:hypothetical protein